jgi:hypothetical protein
VTNITVRSQPFLSLSPLPAAIAEARQLNRPSAICGRRFLGKILSNSSFSDHADAAPAVLATAVATLDKTGPLVQQLSPAELPDQHRNAVA